MSLETGRGGGQERENLAYYTPKYYCKNRLFAGCRVWLGWNWNHLQSDWRPQYYQCDDSWSKDNGYFRVLRHQKLYWRHWSAWSRRYGLCELNCSNMPQNCLWASWQSKQKHRRCLFACVEVQKWRFEDHWNWRLHKTRISALKHCISKSWPICPFFGKNDSRYG